MAGGTGMERGARWAPFASARPPTMSPPAEPPPPGLLPAAHPPAAEAPPAGASGDGSAARPNCSVCKRKVQTEMLPTPEGEDPLCRRCSRATPDQRVSINATRVSQNSQRRRRARGWKRGNAWEHEQHHAEDSAVIEAWCKRCGRQFCQEFLRSCEALHQAAPNPKGWVYLPACLREGCVSKPHLPWGVTHELTPTQMEIFRTMTKYICTLEE